MDQVPTPTGEAERPPLSRRRSFALLFLLILLVEVVPLTYTLITPALTRIGAEFGTGQVAWVITTTTLVGAAFTPLVGKLGDIHGKKLLLIVVSGAFVLGSVIAAFAPTFPLLLLGRALQGIGLPLLVLTYGLIRDILPPKIVAPALGFVATGMGISAVIGPLVGGYLIDNYGYTGIFWFQAVHTLVAAGLVAAFLPETTLLARSRLDWTGAVLLAVGSFALLLGLSESLKWGLGSPLTWISVLGGAGVLAAWVIYERRPEEPLIDRALLRKRPVAMALTASATVQFAFVGHSMLIPLMVMVPESAGMGYGLGSSALGVSRFLLPFGVVAMIAGPVAGQAARKFGARTTLMTGGGAVVVAGVLLAQWHDTVAQLVLAMVVFGIGLGAASSALPNLLIESVPARSQGIAGGMMNLTGSLGSAFGTQMLVVVLAVPGVTKAGGSTLYPESGFVAAFYALAAVGLVAVIAAACAGTRASVPLTGTDNGAQPATAAP